MISEKPSWVRHEGMQIFSIDVQPGGLRFATGGGDHKVRIWNMKSVGKNFENDESTQRLLATLRDHFGSVNCVRWAKHGRYIASGSDDQVILVHERKPGSGTTEFGSGEPPDIENWKVAMTLRGHTADVVDLNWSPDDSILASGSLDNTIHIWNMSNGICTAVLRGHSSLVKGVTWDPIGSFIASQSDDKTVIIWRTSDWSLAHRTDGHWAKSLGSTFFRRLGWSPCGHFITTTHGFQKPRHSAPVLERGEWAATFDFLGHNAPIIVVKFNHSMFRRNSTCSQEVKAAPVGWTNGTSKIGGKESQPYNVIAIGSQDRTITVWTTASPRPLFVAKHFFTQSVVDLSWSPDGYSVFACSLDGTVATFHFEMKELGHRLSDAELDELKRSRYGDVRGRQANLAESPAQLLLEAASAKQTTSKKLVSDVQATQAPVKSSGYLGVTTKTSEPQADAEKKTGGVAGDGLNKVSTSGRISSPVKQREYRRPDGRKRIIPEAVGVPVQQQGVTGGAQSELHEFPPVLSDQRKDTNGLFPADGVMREVSVRGTLGRSSDVKERSGVTAKASITESLVIEKVPVAGGVDGNVSVEQSGSVKASGSVAASTTTLSIRVFDKREGEDNIPVCLEARSREHAVNDVVGMGNTCMLKETEIACTRGFQTLWFDRITGKVTVLAGNANFWAVGCEDGCLQVYTKCGRRAMPTMVMGSAATFIDCDESWMLLLVTRKGSLYVWDLFNRKCLLHDSLAALITTDLNSASKGTIKVISAKLSKLGSPLVVLATRHAFLFDMNLMCWLRVADDCFPASNFASSWNFGSIQSGELATLQVEVRKYLARKPGWSRITDDRVQTRAHLEAQLASSLALKSPNEYRQCLLSYIRLLAREADESRLREVCESFLGPPTGMAEATTSEAKDIAWEPCVLGMRKHKLLTEDILPAMASNRKVQRLLNEFMDLLSEYESAQTNLDQEDPALPPPTSAPPVDVTALATDRMDSAPQPLAADHKDSTPVETDQENSVSPGSHRNRLLDSTKSVVWNTQKILEVPPEERDWRFILEESRLRTTPIWKEALAAEVEIMSSSYNYPLMEELKEKRKRRKTKGKGIVSTEQDTQPEAGLTEEATKSTGTPPERSASRKRKQPVETEEDPDEVVVKILRSTTIISDPSGLEPFVDRLLLEEDEKRFKDLGPIETARRLQAQTFQALESSIFLRKYAENCQRRMRELEKSNTSLRKELSESKLEIGASQQRLQEAKKKLKEAESVLELERATTKIELDSYQEVVGRLEEDKRTMIEEMDEIAYGAMVRERGKLAKQYQSGEHVKWPVEKWIRYSEKLDAGGNPSSSEDEKEEGETEVEQPAEDRKEEESGAAEIRDTGVAFEEEDKLGD